MQLYLLRHGDALVNAATDASRPLSPRGEAQVRFAGTVLKKMSVSFDVIISSPLLRAQQTADFVREIVPSREFITSDHLVPASDHRNIFSQLNEISANTVLCIGHEPHLSTMVSLLIAGSRNVQVTMQTASLVHLDVMPPVKSGNGVLRWVIPPEMMQNLLTS